MVTISDVQPPRVLAPPSPKLNPDEFLTMGRQLGSLAPMAHVTRSKTTAAADSEDLPLLVSDNDDSDEDLQSAKLGSPGHVRASETAEEVKRSMKTASTTSAASVSAAVLAVSTPKSALSADQFHYEKNQLMTIVVKYIATKITNSFPPRSPRTIRPNDLPLDKFLLLLTQRLQLTLPLFMKGMVYLFRYMDIVYLLRYLNQSNNFANYAEMDFDLKKLLVGCFKLVLVRERVPKNWESVTGLTNNEVNKIVKTIVTRLNGKLLVKNIELVKMKLEIFRFVKMVTTPV